MLLASLAAGTGVAGHLSEERSLEQSLAPHLAAQNVDGMVIPPWTRAAVEQGRRRARSGEFGGVSIEQLLARVAALAALLPLLLGAVAALRGSRVLAAGFFVIGAAGWLGALVISLRGPPIDRYDVARDDEDAWKLARTLDELEDPKKFHLIDGVDCHVLEEALAPYWGPGWPRVMRKSIPPSLSQAVQIRRVECVARWLAELEHVDRYGPSRPLEGDFGVHAGKTAAELRAGLRSSVLLQDDLLHARLERWVPMTNKPL